jgi:hypothetical protein
LKTSIDRVQEGADFAKRTHAYPGRQFRPSWHTTRPSGGPRSARREIKRSEDGKNYIVEVVESRSLGLRVNAVYRQLWDAMRKDPSAIPARPRTRSGLFDPRPRVH